MRYLRKFKGDDITPSDIYIPSLTVPDVSEIPAITSSHRSSMCLEDLPIRVKTMRSARKDMASGRRVVSAPSFNLVASMDNLLLTPPPKMPVDPVISQTDPQLTVPKIRGHKHQRHTYPYRQVSMPVQTLREAHHESNKRSDASYSNIIQIYHEFSPLNQVINDTIREASPSLIPVTSMNSSTSDLSSFDEHSSSSDEDTMLLSPPTVQQKMDAMNKEKQLPPRPLPQAPQELHNYTRSANIRSSPSQQTHRLAPPTYDAQGPTKRQISNPISTNSIKRERKPPQPLTDQQIHRFASLTSAR